MGRLAGCVLAAIGLAPGCAQIGLGGEAGAGSGSGSPDGGSLNSQGEEDGSPTRGECDFGSGGGSDKSVRIVYLVPSDRQTDPRYVANLEQSVRHVQLWMRDRLPAATSFRVHDPVVEVVRTTHQASWYASQANGDQAAYYFWYNATADALAATGGSFDDPNNVWLFYMAADPTCGQSTGAAGHVALFGENDLRGLVQDPRIATCAGDSDSYGRCRWVGGMAILLSFALGVPEPAACADTDPTTACDDKVLTRYGYLSYPDATFSDDQIAYLGNSPFMRAAGLPACALDCAAVVSP